MDEDYCFICGEPLHETGYMSRDGIHTLCYDCYEDEGGYDLYDEDEG